MPASTPQALHALFTQHFAAGDLSALASLYEPDAVLVPQPGERAVGAQAIQAAMAAFISLNGTLSMSPPRVIEAADLAVLFSHWTLTGTDADGNAVNLEGETTDVVRRQADGHWLFAIDSPFGALGAA